jgi:predicted nucleic acid-binding protein
VVSAAVISVVGRAAIARRLHGSAAAEARRELSRRLSAMVALGIDERLLEDAKSVADRYRLRALDALHLAAAQEIRDETLLFATWDGELERAARRAGLTTAL